MLSHPGRKTDYPTGASSEDNVLWPTKAAPHRAFKDASFVLLAVLLAVAGYVYGSRQAPPRLQAAPPPEAVLFPRLGDDPAAELLKLIREARESIDVAVFTFTHPDILEALIEAKARGVRVRVMSDARQTRASFQGPKLSKLVEKGIFVMVNRHDGVMHLKLLVVDHAVAAFGSFNFTVAAGEKNDEVMVITRAPETVRAIESTFERMARDRNRYEQWIPPY
ncbi:MAG: hypothetical protein IMX04_07080 [Candidatus Carbobacillus altaicus]|nr:hypothetical protein [Candidatus Carbobacillus altaicus]